MITVDNLTLQYGGTPLFSHADLKFTAGNCYGIIGANGAGKSTFLQILSGELEPTAGSVEIKPGVRMSVLKQDQNMYDEYPVLTAVIMCLCVFAPQGHSFWTRNLFPEVKNYAKRSNSQ